MIVNRKYSSKSKLTPLEGESKDISDKDIKENVGDERVNRSRRGGSNPEREISEDDTETAEFQSNLRKLAAAKLKPGLSQSTPQLHQLVEDSSQNSDSNNNLEAGQSDSENSEKDELLTELKRKV